MPRRARPAPGRATEYRARGIRAEPTAPAAAGYAVSAVRSAHARRTTGDGVDGHAQPMSRRRNRRSTHMSVRRLLATVGGALLGSLALATPAAAHSSAQPV